MGGGEVVLALIEIDAGLLTLEEVGIERESVHADAHRAVDCAMHDAFFLGQGFAFADRDVVAQHDCRWREEFLEDCENLGQSEVHALVEGLEHEGAIIPVDHKTREQIRFSKDDAVGIGIVDHVTAVEDGVLDAAAEEGPVDRFGFVREYTE